MAGKRNVEKKNYKSVKKMSIILSPEDVFNSMYKLHLTPNR